MSQVKRRKHGFSPRRLSLETLESRSMFALDLDSPVQDLFAAPEAPAIEFESSPGEVAIAAANASGNWVAAGPTAIFGGQTENIPGNRVSGAGNALLLHPTDANRALVGTVNGGIWTTNNLTATNPTWTPRTDEAGSLSIGALTSDLADPSFNRLWAGIGRFSSLNRDGGARTGLLRSVNGGQAWAPVTGGGVLVGKNISGLYAKGNTIVVAANVADSFTTNNVGLFRSTNGGNTFVQLNNAPGTGLPTGLSYDLVVDPINTNTLYASIWQILPTDGIYKSTNAGATWTKVSNAAIDGLIGNTTSNIELAVGRNNNVYAGIINQGVLSGLFRSGNGGANWAQLDLPTTNENGSAIGLHPRPKGPGLGAAPADVAGGQGAIHFSIAADPVDHNVVYVGGDRQPIQQPGQPNSIGARDFSGRLFRVNASRPSGSQFISLTHNPTTNSNSAPHADSRDMAFAANGWLIEVNDGGVVKRTNPRTTGDWFSLTGNMQNTEFHSVAYDSLSNVIFGGTQDVGTPVQRINSTGWDSLSTADGGVVEIDNQSRAAFNQSVRYTSNQQFGGFRKTTYNASNQVVSTTFPQLLVVGTGQAVTQRDQSLPFYTPIVLNAVDRTRSLVLSNNIYESFDQFENLFLRVSGTSPFLASAYGGTGNADVIYAANASGFFVRTTSFGFFNQITQYTGQTAVDIALDPDNWQNGVIVDRNRVFFFTNAGATVTERTGNLGSLLGGAKIRTVVYLPGAATDAIIVGTDIGTFVMNLATPNQWKAYAPNLPNAPVMDLRYDRVDDVLIAGTLGRGAWKINNASQTIGNRAPNITVPSAILTYTEDGAPVFPGAGGTIIDSDSTNFATGRLTATITTGGEASDRVLLRIRGTVTVNAASQVSVGGVVVGTFSGGIGTQPLVVNFNTAATPSRVTQVLQAIGYNTVSNNPSTTPRTISFRVTDGDGGTSNTVTRQINVVRANDAPALLLNSTGALSYAANGTPALAFATNATVTDPDSTNFAGGRLTVLFGSGASASNRLSLSGQFSFSGNNLLDGTTIIGTRNAGGGVGTTSMVITFNAQATAARIQLLVRSLRFRTIDGAPGLRIVQMTLTDGDGGTSATAQQRINVI